MADAMKHARRWVRALAALPFGLGAAAAIAAPLPADFRLGVAHSDNIARAPDINAVSETWLEAGLTGTYGIDRPRFEAALATDVT
ncbi:MAG: hypothetical protein ACRET4_18185, partial [Steroidobacteraceae bacterium]